MTIFEYLNCTPNQYLYFSDERYYAYGGILLNCYTGEMLTLNNEETIAKQLKVTKFPFKIRNKNGKQLYYEEELGYWVKHEYDNNGNEIRYNNSNGYWEKRDYDDNGNLIRYEDCRKTFHDFSKQTSVWEIIILGLIEKISYFCKKLSGNKK
jgi:hypothetical protein